MEGDERVVNLIALAKELADMPMDDLRSLYPEYTETSGQLISYYKMLRLTRGQLIEAILLEQEQHNDQSTSNHPYPNPRSLPVDTLEIGQKLGKINECINAVIILLNRPKIHGLDNALLEQERDELIRAYHDTIREFDDECVKRGENKMAARVAAREPIFAKPSPSS